jgi:hypothetical protein
MFQEHRAAVRRVLSDNMERSTEAVVQQTMRLHITALQQGGANVANFREAFFEAEAFPQNPIPAMPIIVPPSPVSVAPKLQEEEKKQKEPNDEELKVAPTMKTYASAAHRHHEPTMRELAKKAEEEYKQTHHHHHSDAHHHHGNHTKESHGIGNFFRLWSPPWSPWSPWPAQPAR